MLNPFEPAALAALALDDAEAISGLLAQGLSPFMGLPTRNFNTPLLEAARIGALNCLRALVPHSDIADSEAHSGRDALSLAILGDHVECVRFLAPLANMNHVPLYQGVSALELAVCAGSLSLAEILVSCGAHSGQLSEHGIHLFFSAIRSDDWPRAAFLRELRRAAGEHSALNDRDALFLAAEQSTTDCLQGFLLSLPATTLGPQGDTLLAHAVRHGCQASERALLPLMDPRQKNAHGQSALDVLMAASADAVKACGDDLAPFLPRESALDLLRQHGREAMPRFAATVERDALAQETARSAQAAFEKTFAADATPSPDRPAAAGALRL